MTMRIAAGGARYVSTSGVEIRVDQRLSQSQVDIVVQAIESAGLTPSDVYAVEFEHEGRVVIEHIVNGAKFDPVIQDWPRQRTVL